MHKILTIAGSDSGGGAGIQADIKTFSALGTYGLSVLTAITAQNTIGVQGVSNLSADFIEKQLISVLTDIDVDAVKTGMLANGEIINTVTKKIKEYNIEKLVVDPVMVSTSGDILLEERAIEILKQKLLPITYVVTPNISEAEVLTNTPINNISDMIKAAKIIYSYGPKYVLVKGGHLLGEATDVLFDGDSLYQYSSERIITNNTHGTGCTLSAAIAVFLAKNYQVDKSIELAKKYLTRTLLAGKDLQVGRGSGPVNHFYYLPSSLEKEIF